MKRKKPSKPAEHLAYLAHLDHLDHLPVDKFFLYSETLFQNQPRRREVECDWWDFIAENFLP